jgi:putative transposase
VIVLLRVVLRLLADLAGLIALSVRPRRAIEAENLVLRRQLALFKERGMKPRRVDAATRASLALLSQLCDWRSCLVVVRPETVLRGTELDGDCSGAASRDRAVRRFLSNCGNS